MTRLFLLLALLPLFLQSQNLETSIYAQVDILAKQPTLERLEKLDVTIDSFTQQAATQNEHMALVVLDCQMGYYYTQFNIMQRAIKHYERAWSRYTSQNLSGYDIIDYCLKPLGNLYTKTGAFALAEQTIKIYINLAEKHKNTNQKLSGWLNLAIVYHSTGNFKTAVQILEQALQTKGISKDLKAQLQNNLANSLIALKDIESAKRLLNSIDSNSLLTKAQLALTENKLDEALQFIATAEEQLKTSNTILARDLAKLYVKKAEVFLLKDDTIKAETYFKNALKILLPLQDVDAEIFEHSLYPENTFLAIFDGLASLQTNTTSAISYYDLSFYVSKLLQDNLIDQQSQLILNAEDRRRSEKCIALYYDEYLENGASVYTYLAFQYAELTKARLLQLQVNERSLLEQYPNNGLLLRRQQLQQQQEALITQLIKAEFQNNNQDLNSLQAKLRSVSINLKSVESEVRNRFKIEPASEVNLDSIQAKLKLDNATLVEFFYGKDAIYQFQISAETIAFIKIEKTESIVQLLRDFLTFFEAPSNISEDVSAYAEVASALFQELKLPDIKHKSNWILIPDGLLNFVPFDALLTQYTSAFQFEKMPFLVKQVTLFYQNSAAFYLKDYILQKKEQSVLGVFPVFLNTSEELKYSLEEAKTLESFDNATVLLNGNATKSQFFNRAAKHHILHLSTHATGGNQTTPAQLALYDEPLLLNELYSLNLQPDLVVLSACETAIGKLKLGEGAMSLSRGFQYAGAKQLLVTQWQVNDKSTADIIQSFYKHYSNGTSVGGSIKKAKLDYLENNLLNNAAKSPYYWAAFVAISQPEQDSRNLSWLWYVVFLIVVAFIIVYHKQKTKKD